MRNACSVRKIWLTIVMLLLGTMNVIALTPTAVSNIEIPAASAYHLYDAIPCIGNISIKLRSVNPIIGGEYMFVNCTQTGPTLWSCPCKSPLSINAQAGNRNQYDFIAQYVLKDRTTRTINFNNLKIVEPKAGLAKVIAKLTPTGPTKFAVQILMVALIGIVIAVIVLRKMLRSPPRDIIDERYSWDRK